MTDMKTSMDTLLDTVERGQVLVREATATIAEAHDYVKEAKKIVGGLQKHIKMLTYEVKELKAGRGMPGTGWTRPDGEEFFGEEALKMQDEWWAEKFKGLKAELDDLKWMHEDD